MRFHAVLHLSDKSAGVFGEEHDGSHIVGVGKTDVCGEDDIVHCGDGGDSSDRLRRIEVTCG